MATLRTLADLWPADFGEVTTTSPGAILRRQAELLGRKTKNVVQGEVRTDPYLQFSSGAKHLMGSAASFAEGGEYIRTGEFQHIFYLKVPALENYRYQLLTVISNPLDYPVRVEAHDVDTICESEEAFIQALREILSSEHTVRIIRNLMEQVEAR